MCELLLVRNQPGEDALSNGLFVWSQCAVSSPLGDAGQTMLESILVCWWTWFPAYPEHRIANGADLSCELSQLFVLSVVDGFDLLRFIYWQSSGKS